MNQVEQNSSLPISFGRTIFMGILSMVFCMSGFLTVFTPLPVGISSLLYGRTIGLVLAVIVSGIFFSLINQMNAQSSSGDFSFAYFFMACMFIALSLSEVIHRRMDPIKGIIGVGFGIVILSLLILWSYLDVRGISLNELVMEHVQQFSQKVSSEIEEIKKTNYDNAVEIESLIKQPEKIAKQILSVGPGIMIVAIFIVIWTNMYLMLLFQRVLGGTENAYNEKILLKFKVPEKFIFGVIAGLILVLFGEQLGQSYVDIGYLILMVLGIFYFFHGVGIYFEFLDYMQITGFLRTILVVLTLLTAYQIIALVGVFDMFVNFRKFFKKKNIID